MADQSQEGGKIDAARVGRIADRLEKHAANWAQESAYQFSYEPGSNRFYQANRRAHIAEEKFDKALAELRTLITAALSRTGEA